MIIFTLTAVDANYYIKRELSPTRPGAQTFSWYVSIDEAVEELLLYPDMFLEGGSYTHVVIEAVEDGLHRMARPEHWYDCPLAWDCEDSVNYAITKLHSKPEWAEGIMCWSLG